MKQYELELNHTKWAKAFECLDRNVLRDLCEENGIKIERKNSKSSREIMANSLCRKTCVYGRIKLKFTLDD